MRTRNTRDRALGGSPLPRLAGLDDDLASVPDAGPLAGVVLVLLLFAMVLMPPVYADWSPSAATHSSRIPEHRLQLGLWQGQFYAGSPLVRMPARELTGVLAAERKAWPVDTPLYLASGRDEQYSDVLTALAAAREAGFRRVGLVVEAPRGTPYLPRSAQ